MKVELIVDGKICMMKEVQHIEELQIVKTVEMILDYAQLHKGNKIKMLKGLQALR